MEIFVAALTGWAAMLAFVPEPARDFAWPLRSVVDAGGASGSIEPGLQPPAPPTAPASQPGPGGRGFGGPPPRPRSGPPGEPWIRAPGGPPEMEPPFPLEGDEGGPVRRMERHGPPEDPLLRIIAETRPELAQRLEALRRRSPERFGRVLAEALMSRLEDTLSQAEEEVGPISELAPPPKPPGPDRHPGPGSRPEESPEQRGRMRELEQRQQQLENRSRDLATQLREARTKNAPADEQTRLREALGQVLSEQFDIRTEWRTMELERVQSELARLRNLLERMQRDAEQRDRERAVIIERRINQLLGDTNAAW